MLQKWEHLQAVMDAKMEWSNTYKVRSGADQMAGSICVTMLQ